MARRMLRPQCQVSERYRQDVADCGGQPIEREVSWRSRGHGGRGQLSSLWMCGAADGRQPERWRCLGGQEVPHGSPNDIDEAGPACVNTGRLWAGGAATAIVAALAVVAGVLIARGVLGVPVLAPAAAGNFGDSSTAVCALLAAGCALLATGLLHVLLLGAPRPLSFFVWITGLADVIVAAAPFTQPAPLASKIFAAIINIVVGVAVITLLSGVGRSAARPADMSSSDRPIPAR
jgi:hypothetical protein